MPMGVLYAYTHKLLRCVRGRLYTQRGFLHCLFGMIGFPRTTMSE